jgi:predicted DNA-binding transcriptional regulator AlpA
MEKKVPKRGNALIARARDPGLREFWNSIAVVREAAKVGLPMNSAGFYRAVEVGRGPKPCAIAGKTLLFEPATVREWFRSELERRRLRLTTHQLQLGATEEEFGSVAA